MDVLELLDNEEYDQASPKCSCSSSICICDLEPLTKEEPTNLTCKCPKDAICSCAIAESWRPKKREPDPCECPSDTACVCTVVPDICVCPGDTVCVCRASKASLVAKRLTAIAPCTCHSDTVCTCIVAEGPPEKPAPVEPCVCPSDNPCVCYLARSSEREIAARKMQILNTAMNTENYLKDRRISDLVRFLLTKLIASGSDNPSKFLEKLLDDCMLFRAGYGMAPVIYEDRHLEAVVKSFDPGQRGWVTASQVRRAYTTLGFTPRENLDGDKRISTQDFLNNLKSDQERELKDLLCAGILKEEDSV